MLGTANHKQDFYSYLMRLFTLHFIVCTSLSLFGFVIGLALWKSFNLIATGFWGASISSPFILLYWLLRRACYAISSPQTAMKGSLVYAVILPCGFIVNHFLGLTVMRSFLLLSAASIIASFFLFSLLFKGKQVFGKNNIGLRLIWHEHWQYGRWVVGSAIVYWVGYTITVPAIGFILGLAGSGAFRAMQNLIMPLQQIGTALGALLLPWFSKQTTNLKPSDLNKKARLIILGFFSSGLSYLLFLLLTKEWLMELLYPESGYSQYSWLIVLLGIFAIFDLATQGLSIFLRAIQKPDAILRSQVGGAITSITLNLFLIWKFGLIGAGYGMIITGGVVLLIMILEYRQTSLTRDEKL